MTVEEVVKKLTKLRSPRNIAGMARFGIKPKKEPLGVPMPTLRDIAKDIKRQTSDSKTKHKLALNLWRTGIYEARLIASFIDDPKLVTEKQMESWVKDFDNWATCDTVCGTLFDKTEIAYKKSAEWIKRNEEYVKRAGFVVGTWLTVHDKKAKDSDFYYLLNAIKKHATDERIYVKKAINWALRQIGKSRSQNLYNLAVKTANSLKKIDSKEARWIASDALRELSGEKIKTRVKKYK